jgi:hypothetical protein
MDFNKVNLFGKKSFADLLKEIYDNSRVKEKQISELVQQLKPMIKEPGDAMMLVPLLKEYLELGIKNDEQLVKMAGIVQRAMASANTIAKEGNDLVLTEKEKAELIQNLHEIKDIQKN